MVNNNTNAIVGIGLVAIASFLIFKQNETEKNADIKKNETDVNLNISSKSPTTSQGEAVKVDKKPTIRDLGKPLASDSKSRSAFKESQTAPIVSTSVSRLLRPADTPTSVQKTTPLSLNRLNIVDQQLRDARASETNKTTVLTPLAFKSSTSNIPVISAPVNSFISVPVKSTVSTPVEETKEPSIFERIGSFFKSATEKVF